MSFTLKRDTFAKERLRVQAEELFFWLKETLKLGSEETDSTAASLAAPTSRPRAMSRGVVQDFFDVLQTGVVLCRLAEEVSPASEWPSGAPKPIPDVKCPYKANAKPGSFQARDNITNFLKAAKELGVPDVALFTTEALVGRKDDAQVVNCLLHLARIGADNGHTAPAIIQLERELGDQQQYKLSQLLEEEEECVPAQFNVTRKHLLTAKGVLQDVIDNAKKTLAEDIQKAAEESKDSVDADNDDDDDDDDDHDDDDDDDDDDKNADDEKADVPVALSSAEAGTVPFAAVAVPKSAALQALQAAKDTPEIAELLGDHVGTDPSTIDENETCDIGSFFSWLKMDPKQPKKSQYLPRAPRKGDRVDEALSLEMQAHNLDLRVRRIVKADGDNHVAVGYRVGGPRSAPVQVRLVRGLLLVWANNGWEGIVGFLQRKFVEQLNAS